MQAVARAKEKIKRFRRRRTSSMSVPTAEHGTDLPPPYSENPPVNPFYNEYLHAVDSPNVSMNDSYPGRGSSPSDARPLVTPVAPPSSYHAHLHYSPLGHPPLYPLVQDAPSQNYQVSSVFLATAIY